MKKILIAIFLLIVSVSSAEHVSVEDGVGWVLPWTLKIDCGFVSCVFSGEAPAGQEFRVTPGMNFLTEVCDKTSNGRKTARAYLLVIGEDTAGNQFAEIAVDVSYFVSRGGVVESHTLRIKEGEAVILGSVIPEQKNKRSIRIKVEKINPDGIIVRLGGTAEKGGSPKKIKK